MKARDIAGVVLLGLVAGGGSFALVRATDATVAASWLEAVGTTGALGLALRGEYTNRRRQLELEAQRLAERDRSQASKVTAWCTGAEPAVMVAGELEVKYHLVIRNGSEAAIYSPQLLVGDSFEAPKWAVGGGDSLGAIPPGESRTSTEHVIVRSEAAAPWPPPVIIHFTDAGGRTWQRGADGTLAPQGPHRRASLRPDPYRPRWATRSAGSAAHE